MRKGKVLLFIVIVLLFSISILHSVTIRVPADSSTIQAGINGALDGDTVLVADGTYTGEGNRDIDFLGRAIVVMSENGPDVTIIDCEGTYEDNHRGFKFNSEEDTTSVLEGFTITNGYMRDGLGGAIRCYNSSSPKIVNNIITGNTVTGWGNGAGIGCMSRCDPVIIRNTITSNAALSQSDGGGICFYDDCAPLIIANTISENSAGGNDGGGIACYSSLGTIIDNIITENDGLIGGGIFCNNDADPTITGNIIWRNAATYSGGGISVERSSPTIEYNLIIQNTAGYNGGGIHCYMNASPLIHGNTILGNTAEDYSGGGINCRYYSSPTISDNRISGNSTTGYGGGIYFYNSSPAIINNRITDNTATNGAGIYSWVADSPEITNNTIAGNTATSNGGAIFCHDESFPTVMNTILWENDAQVGQEIYVGSSSYPSTLEISYSDVDGGWASVYVESGCTVNWGAGMIDSDPIFMMGPDGYYYLSQILAGELNQSPCANAGNPRSGVRDGTTRTDEVCDEWPADMGYHYNGSCVPLPHHKAPAQF